MTDKPTLFRSLHTSAAPLLLANAWDAASARVIESSGAPAIATTSAGVSWALGRHDGGALQRDEAIAHLARITAAVSVPVSADIESGYGATPADVAATIRAVADAGAVGVNIEDALHSGSEPLRAIDDQCARIAAARSAAGDRLFINLRIDTYLRGAAGFDETVARAKAFLAAGADGIFVPGVDDPELIAELVAAIPGPLNVLAGPGSPAVERLAALGVARISLGSSVAEAAYAVAARATSELLGSGTYHSLDGKFDFSTLDALMHG